MHEFWHYLYLDLVIFNQNQYWFNINYNISIFTIPKSELFKPIFLVWILILVERIMASSHSVTDNSITVYI